MELAFAFLPSSCPCGFGGTVPVANQPFGAEGLGGHVMSRKWVCTPSGVQAMIIWFRKSNRMGQ